MRSSKTWECNTTRGKEVARRISPPSGSAQHTMASQGEIDLRPAELRIALSSKAESAELNKVL